jgi:ribonuclease P protein component
MLAKIYCLRKKKDFTRVYQQGRAYSSSILWIKVLPNYLDYSRVGIVVSKKTARQAVARNKIKRRLRSLLRERLPRLKSGYDLIITVRPEILQQSYSELAETLDNLLTKAQLF